MSDSAEWKAIAEGASAVIAQPLDKAKSRWCVRGHQDEDACQLQVYAPAPCMEALMLFLVVALMYKLVIYIGDIKNAFCQSELLNRTRGKVFVELCDGVPVPPGSLIELIAP
eukprot:6252335-Pyramimonas_sp.AAC.1